MGLANRLSDEPLGARAVHLCVDMQRLFAEPTAWRTPWLPRVLPQVRRIVARHPSATVFTRFVPAGRPGEGCGTWRRYYERWAEMTLERLGREMVELVPDLARFVPPAEVLDKRTYSPWLDPALDASLARRRADALVVTGGETDVCVLATVLGAVDRGYRVILVEDALCSVSDETHDAVLALYRRRFGEQIEVAGTDDLLGGWAAGPAPA